MTRKTSRIVVTINGRRVTRDLARISIFDNALLYAVGVFETLLATEDRVVFLEEHLDRLYRGSATLGLLLPVERSRLSVWMLKTAGYHPDRLKKLRLTITRGESARWVGKSGRPQVILAAAPHTMPRRPFRLLISDLRVDQESGFRKIKTLSYALNAAAYEKARGAGYDDALLLNTSNKVAEITSANIFWVQGETVHTPPLSAGCLEGVTRIKVIEVARDLGYRLVERNTTLGSCVRADELFLTSSLKLALPIGLISDGRTTWRFKTGTATRRIASELRKRALAS